MTTHDDYIARLNDAIGLEPLVDPDPTPPHGTERPDTTEIMRAEIQERIQWHTSAREYAFERAEEAEASAADWNRRATEADNLAAAWSDALDALTEQS